MYFRVAPLQGHPWAKTMSIGVDYHGMTSINIGKIEILL
jgi:hypothetical protein